MRFVPYLVLLAEVLLFYRQDLFAGHVIPWDLNGFFLPHMHVYVDALKSWQLPLWDPYTYCGRPFQANIQTGVFYPPVAFTAWLGAIFGHEHLRYLLDLNVIFHVLLAGVFSYWLGLALKLRGTAALLLATTYQLGGFFAAHAEHMTAIQVAAWIPFAFFCILRLKDGPAWRYGLLLAAGFAMAILAGLATLTAALFALSLVLALLLWWLDSAKRALPAAVLIAIVAAIVLTLLQLAPTYQLTNLSIAQYRSDYLKSGGGLPLSALASLFLPNYNGVFNPSTYHGPADLTFMYLYSGWIALLLSVAALIRSRTRLTAVFGLMLVITGLITIGDSTPIGKFVMSLLPLKIRIGLEPEYVACAFLLSLAVLAGMGLDAVIKHSRFRCGLVAIAAIELILVSSVRPMNSMPAGNDPGWSRTQFEGDRSKLHQVQTASHGLFTRFDTIGGAMNWAMAAPSIGARSANGNDPFALTRLMSVRRLFTGGERWGSYYEVKNLKSPVLDVLNVGFLVSRRTLSDEELAGTGFQGNPTYLIYVKSDTRPTLRFWLVSRIKPAASEASALTLLGSADFRPHNEAIVEGFNGQAPAGRGGAGVMHYEMHRIELRVIATGPSYLVTSEVHYPGWRAFIDGNETPIYYTNVAFRGIAIPAGEHTVEMRFSPPLLWWTGAISLAAWLAWGCLWFRRARRETMPPS